MTDGSWGNYDENQVRRIERFKRELEAARGESVPLDEAAREWVKQYAKFVREAVANSPEFGDSTD